MDDSLIGTSKFLSYVLRHNPDALDLTLNPGGWVNVDALIKRARAEGHSLSRSRIRDLIASGEKTRFTFSDDGSQIRANYGHSIAVDLDLTPTKPPEVLYHGTTEAALPSIRAEGLRPQSRQYVHLSQTRSEAKSVGQRHGPPVVLPIDASSMHDAGFSLYQSTDAVWLTRRVPSQFLRFPD